VSKAFTKEDDTEALMVPPRAPLPRGVPNYVTTRGLAQLRAEIARLEEERSRDGENAIAQDGDTPEASRRLTLLNRRIAELATRIGSALVLEECSTSTREVRFGANQTLTEATHLADHFAQSSGAEAVERAGVKITRQATKTPGKVRWLVQKKFPAAIGTKGETVLRVVLDMSGRIVTAFPADKLLTILGTVAAAEFLTEGIADAAERVGAEAERLEQLKEMERNQSLMILQGW
jgi:hypothetical protein